MNTSLDASERVTLSAIEEAARRIAGVALITPLVQFPLAHLAGRALLKAESLQPIGAALAFRFEALGTGNHGSVVAVVSGGNVAPDALADVLRQAS